MQERYSIAVTIRNAHDDGASTLMHKSSYEQRDDADGVAEYIYDAGNAGIVEAVRVMDNDQPEHMRTVTMIDADGIISYDPDAERRAEIVAELEQVNRDILIAINRGHRATTGRRKLQAERDRLEHELFTIDHGADAASQIIQGRS